MKKIYWHPDPDWLKQAILEFKAQGFKVKKLDKETILVLTSVIKTCKV